MILYVHKIILSRLLILIILFGLLLFPQCTAVDKKTYLKGFYQTYQYRPHQQLTYAEKHGYNSECLVLMEGPVPSRMEPCAIGDRRSGRDMYRETEVEVAGDFFPVNWQIVGYAYSLHVNESYYQDVILYSSSYQRWDQPWHLRTYTYRNIYSKEVIRNNSRYSNPMSPYRFNMRAAK